MELDLTHVRTFVVTAEQLHFGRAAALLFLTQQALSKRIQRLEQTLGEPLFVRGKHGVQLSEAGRRFLPHARELIASVDIAAAAVRGRSRPLRVDVWGYAVAPARLVRRLVQESPELLIEQSMRRGLPSAASAVQRGELDVCFGRIHDLGQPWPSDLAHRLVCLEPGLLALGATHPLAHAALLRQADLDGSRLWVARAGNSPETFGFFRRFAEHFDVALFTEGQNLGIADQLWDVLRHDPTLVTVWGRDWPLPADASVVTVPFHPRPWFPWSLVWREGDRQPQLNLLIDLVVTTGRSEGWLAYNPDHDWLPDVDVADLRPSHASRSSPHPAPGR